MPTKFTLCTFHSTPNLFMLHVEENNHVLFWEVWKTDASLQCLLLVSLHCKHMMSCALFLVAATHSRCVQTSPLVVLHMIFAVWMQTAHSVASNISTSVHLAEVWLCHVSLPSHWSPGLCCIAFLGLGFVKPSTFTETRMSKHDLEPKHVWRPFSEHFSSRNVTATENIMTSNQDFVRRIRHRCSSLLPLPHNTHSRYILTFFQMNGYVATKTNELNQVTLILRQADHSLRDLYFIPRCHSRSCFYFLY